MVKRNAKNGKATHNEFDETLVASVTFYEKHKNVILYGSGAVLALLIVALLVHQFYITPRNQRADESIAMAQQLFSDGNYDKALNGGGDTLGFLAVADKYKCTDAGNLAHLYAAKCYAETEKYQEAINELKKFSSCGDAMVSPAAIAMEGNLYAQLGDNEKAVSLLVKAADKAANNTLSPAFLIQAGQIYEALGKNDEALGCYKRIKEKFQNSMQYSEADKYIERLGGN